MAASVKFFAAEKRESAEMGKEELNLEFCLAFGNEPT